jgi:tetratricopeptide (TPR) repeat protein
MTTKIGIGAVALLWLTSSCVSATPLPETPARSDRARESRELVARGNAAAALGDLTRAEQYFVTALRAGADEQRILMRLLAVCVSDQRYAVAASYAEQYLYRHPGDALISHTAATLHLALGEHARARQLLEAVVAAQPQWPDPHFALASLLRDGGDGSDAADRHDLEYLKLAPSGRLAEVARTRLRRASP